MAATSAENTSRSTVSDAETEHFSRLARHWWDEDGEFAALHKINPARIQFVRDQLCSHFGRDPAASRPFAGLNIIDIGCGGGLMAEPLTRLGAAVTGLDASDESIRIALTHAAGQGLEINYQTSSPEAFAQNLPAGLKGFDAVVNMEVIEHAEDPEGFVIVCADLVRPGGIFLAATLNRTLKSLALAKFAAEYVLRWVPPGTHDWRKFVRPSEFAAYLRKSGLSPDAFKGISYAPLDGTWSLTDDLDVNYLLAARKPAEGS
ncbi:MAG: bifunctional 2-polyprenyl-6-hydroxyphenol methylase/3-demethylubiquinol 3-O-methyltransferase UbiG [Rhodospirillales bacterium]|nr:bifunctional 2-polyprenyl-6-hydroxyphenol methylase/3-demethylubiquinol 3-O-methyltransferase UbiG [Rhodospirillales bacterium]